MTKSQAIRQAICEKMSSVIHDTLQRHPRDRFNADAFEVGMLREILVMELCDDVKHCSIVIQIIERASALIHENSFCIGKDTKEILPEHFNGNAVRACCVCYPGNTVLGKREMLLHGYNDNIEVSHGYCQPCFEEFKRENRL